jgi:hypothetical protein
LLYKFESNLKKQFEFQSLGMLQCCANGKRPPASMGAGERLGCFQARPRPPAAASASRATLACRLRVAPPPLYNLQSSSSTFSSPTIAIAALCCACQIHRPCCFSTQFTGAPASPCPRARNEPHCSASLHPELGRAVFSYAAVIELSVASLSR